MELSAVDVHYLVQEWQEYLPARIQQIYQEKETFWIVIHSKSTGKKILYLAPKYAAVLDQKPEAPEKPTQLASVLRKYLTNAWIESITQEGFERIIHLTCKKEETYHVYVELFSTGNILLCDAAGKIMHALHMREWRHRSIKRGQQYVLPPQTQHPLTISEQQLSVVLQTDKELVKVLATQLGLGGTYAEEVCVGMDKMLPAQEANAAAVVNGLRAILHRPLQPTMYERAYPFPLKTKGEGARIPGFSEGLAKTLPSTTEPKKEDASDRLIKAQEERKLQLIAEEAEERRKGELIYEHYAYVRELLSTTRDLQKKQGWQAVKELLKKDKRIVDIDEKQGTITVDV